MPATTQLTAVLTAKDELSKELKKVSKGLDTVKKDLKSANTTAKKTSGSFDNMTKGLLRMGAGFLSIRAGIGIVKNVVGNLISFETAIGNISTLIPENTKAIAEMRKGISDLSRTIPKSANELGAAAYDIMSAGITDASEALFVLEASGKLAVAGLGTTTEAVGLVTSAINAFGIEASEANKVANTIFATVRAGKTTVGELSRAFGNVAAGAVGAGVSFEEVQAATAALTLTGFRTATAQERLRALFDEMTRSSGKLSVALKGVGVTNIETAIKTDGFKGILDKLFEATGENTIGFKNMFSSVEAGGAALALVTGVSEDYDKILQDIITGTGDLQKAFETQAETVQNKAIVAQNNFNALMEDFSSRILPELIRGLDLVITLFNRIAGVRDTFDSFTDSISQQAAELSLLAQENKKVSDGMSTYEGNLISSAIAANQAETEISKLETTQKLLNTALSGSFLESINATKALKDFGEESAGFIGKAPQKMKERLIEVNQELEKQKNILFNTKPALEQVLAPYEDINEEIKKLKEGLEDAGPAMKDFGSSSKSTAKSVDTAMTKATQSFIDFKKKSSNLGEEYKKVSEDGVKNIADLNSKNKEALASIDEQIKNVKNSMAELNKSFSGAQTSDVQNLAEQFIKAEEKIASLKEKLRSETDSSNITKLKQQLSQEEQALADSANTAQEIQVAIDEARRRAGLNDLERAIEDFDIKRELAQQEFDQRMTQLQEELSAMQAKRQLEEEQHKLRLQESQTELAKKLADINVGIKKITEEAETEKALYEEKIAIINKLILDGEAIRQEATKATYNVTKDLVEKEIDLYNRLAKAIREASSAKIEGLLPRVSSVVGRASGGIVKRGETTLVGENGPEIAQFPSGTRIIPNGQGGSFGGVNIYITGTFLSEDAAEIMGDKIIDKLKRNIRI